MTPTKRPRRAMLKEELTAICGGDHVAAMVLERILWKTRVDAEYAEFYDGKDDDSLTASKGWITASAQTLADDTMLGVSQKTIRRRLLWLVKEGYLIENSDSARWRAAASYKANVDAVQAALQQYGFELDKARLPNSEALRMKKQLLSEDPAISWDNIPSAYSPNMLQQKLPGMEEMNNWLANQRLVKDAPRHVQLTSWLLYHHGGFTPHGTKKQWFSACSGLWEAAGGDEIVLNSAIEAGQSVRTQRGLTMSGPRSFITFALDAKARHELAKRTTGASGEGQKEAAAGRLNGQRVSTSEGGKQVIEIGRRNAPQLS